MIKYRNRARPNQEEFENDYYNKKMTVQELSKKYKVKTSTIYNWAYLFRKKIKND